MTVTKTKKTSNRLTKEKSKPTPVKGAGKKSVTIDTNFVGLWQSYESRFRDNITERTPPSTWMIIQGNIYVFSLKPYKCKANKNKIKIPTGTPKCYWIGEMLTGNILKISTDNGMMSYYCKRV